MCWSVYVHPLVDHLAEVQSLVGELRPATVEDNLKDGSHESPGRLYGMQSKAAISAPLSLLHNHGKQQKLRFNEAIIELALNQQTYGVRFKSSSLIQGKISALSQTAAPRRERHISEPQRRPHQWLQ